MTWVEMVPVVAVALAVVYVPGLALAFAMGARRFTLVAIAPALSVAIIALSAIALGLAGIPWSVPAVAAISLAAATLAYLARRLGPPAPRDEARARPELPWLAAGVGLGAVIVTVQLVTVLAVPDAVSQTFDAPFHQNVLRYIADTGSASSFDITGLILAAGESSFYPAAWHGVASLVWPLVDVPIPAAANAVNLVFASVVWVSGSVLLARIIVPGSRVALVAAGILSAAFPAFPLLMLDYGVLYAYFLGLALLPVALALTVSVAGLGPRLELGRWWQLPALALSLVACALAQPAAALAWGALSIPIAIWWFASFARRDRRGWLVLSLGVCLIAGIGVLAGAWYYAGRIGMSAPWGPHTTFLGALTEAVGHAPPGHPLAIAASVLVLAGLIDIVLRRRQLWLAASWALAVALFGIAATLESLPLRNAFTGIFYNDAPRLAALIVIVSVPIATVGTVAVCSLARRVVWPRLSARLGERPARAVAVASAAAGTVLLVVATQGNAIAFEMRQSAEKYGFDGIVAMLSEDEARLIERLDATTAESAVIAGSAWTGTSYAYALGEREVITPHFNRSTDPDEVIINERLNRALTDPAVCEAVRELGVEYVLDFGSAAGDVGHGWEFDGLQDYPGLADLSASGVVTPVDREGDAVLYRITAC